MRRLRPTDLALPLVAAGAAAVVLGPALMSRAGDWLFATILWTAVLFTARQVWRTRRAAQRARLRAYELQHTSADIAARAAVVAERARLSADIESYLCELVTAIGQRASAALDAADPRADLRWIQSRAQQANGELRRQLGLLRADEPIPKSDRYSATADLPRLRTGDVVLCVCVVAVAFAEGALLVPMEHPVSWLSRGLTVATAATVLGRRTHLVLATLTAATLMATGAIISEPVHDGLWLATVLALLAWTLAARGTRHTWAALVILVAADLVSRQFNQPENVPINIAILAVATVAGAIVGRHRRRLVVSASAAEARSEELMAASAEAVAAERRQMARELHDLVSHAVSLVAVQAGAAEIVWPTDPLAARDSIRIIATTAEQTLAELDRMMPGRLPVKRTVADLPVLVDRMKAAGLDVTMAVDLDPDPASLAAIYRVVQEALTNALRHAPESHVDVSVTSQPPSVTTAGHDEGTTLVRVISIGPVSSPSGRRGFGLIGLRERVEQIGGTLDVRPQLEPPGFAVTAVLPASRTSEVT